MHFVFPPIWTGIPFLSIIILMGLGPYVIPRLWHRFELHILSILISITIGSLWLNIGPCLTVENISHVLIHEYFPFVILIISLYIITSGIYIKFSIEPTPFINTVFLGIGSLLSSLIGTMGASMVLLRPFIHINSSRNHKTHSLIFFILLISNIGGCLTPIGDPPLFLGYLHGVEFFWPLKFLIQPFLVIAGSLLLIYYFLDRYFFMKFDERIVLKKEGSFTLEGKVNILFLLCVMVVIISSGFLQIKFPNLPPINLIGQKISFIQVMCNSFILILSFSSYYLTPKTVRHKQHFSWHPIYEVVRIFGAIFICLIPINLMLEAGSQGPLGFVSNLNESRFSASTLYFWLTGLCSAFLDNAPTYLIFFKMAGGDAETLMTAQSSLLMAISSGAVFMGAMTYIGNAPNFMVRSLAKQSGIKMPSFLGYLGWSSLILLPLFAIMNLILFF